MGEMSNRERASRLMHRLALEALMRDVRALAPREVTDKSMRRLHKLAGAGSLARSTAIKLTLEHCSEELLGDFLWFKQCQLARPLRLRREDLCVRCAAVRAGKLARNGTESVGVTPLRACAHCGTTEQREKGMGKCARCGVVYYCGEACQRANWRRHRTECLTRGARAAPLQQ